MTKVKMLNKFQDWIPLNILSRTIDSIIKYIQQLKLIKYQFPLRKKKISFVVKEALNYYLKDFFRYIFFECLFFIQNHEKAEKINKKMIENFKYFLLKVMIMFEMLDLTQYNWMILMAYKDFRSNICKTINLDRLIPILNLINNQENNITLIYFNRKGSLELKKKGGNFLFDQVSINTNKN